MKNNFCYCSCSEPCRINPVNIRQGAAPVAVEEKYL